MSNTRQHRQWILEDQSEDTREQDAYLARLDREQLEREAFLGLQMVGPDGSIKLTDAILRQLLNS